MSYFLFQYALCIDRLSWDNIAKQIVEVYKML